MIFLIDHYQVNVVEKSIIYKDNVLSFNMSYSELEYPDLFDNLKSKFFKQQPLFLQCGNQKEEVMILSFVCMSEKDSFKIKKDGIELREDIYGNIVHEILPEDRIDFIMNQVYGTIKLKRLV